MFFWAVVVIVLILAFLAYKDEGLGFAIFTVFIASLIGALVLLIVGSIVSPSMKETEVSKETFKVSNGSNFDISSYKAKFIAVNEKGELTPKEINYDKVSFASKDIREVEVTMTDRENSLFLPWVADTITTVVVR